MNDNSILRNTKCEYVNDNSILRKEKLRYVLATRGYTRSHSEEKSRFNYIMEYVNNNTRMIIVFFEKKNHVMSQLYAVTLGHTWSHLVTLDHIWSHLVFLGF